MLLATLLAAAGTARLGVWQIDRAAEKTRLQHAIDRQRVLPAVAADELARDPVGAAAQHHRSVALHGVWQAVRTVYLENRQMNGQPGFYVVTPLLLDDGSAVLVQRGWVARDVSDRSRISIPPPPPGRVAVHGRIAPAPGRLYEFDAAVSGPIRQNLAIAAFARETGLDLRPLSVVQEDVDEVSGARGLRTLRVEEASQPASRIDGSRLHALQTDGLLRQWPQPGAGVARHHGYAFQWFALSALIIGLYAWFQIIRPRVHRRSSSSA